MSFRSMELTRTSRRCCGASCGAARSRNSSLSCRRRASASRHAAPRTTGRGGCAAWGHEVLLMPPQSIKAYVKRGKNDAIDAAAICEAMSRPTMRFVPVKTVEQQAALTMLGGRDLLPCGGVRRHGGQEPALAKAGGPQQITELLGRLASDQGVPALARAMLGLLASQLEAVNGKLKAIEARLMAWHRHDQTSQCLATIPGVGPIGGVSFALKSLPSRKRGCRTPKPF